MKRKFKIEASSYNNNPTSQILKKGAIEYNRYYIVEDPAGDGYNVYDENFSLVDEGYGSLGSAKEFIEELVESDPERIHCATEEDEQVMYQADMANGVRDVEQQEVQGEQSFDDEDRCYLHKATNKQYSGYQLKHLFKFKEYHGYTGTYEEWLQGQLDSGKLIECSTEAIQATDWDGFSSYDDWKTSIPDYPEDEEEFEEIETAGFWYFTHHGVQPGSIPRRASVLDMIDTPSGTYVKLDCVLNTKELNEYDMKEQAPPQAVMNSNSSQNKVKSVRIARYGQFDNGHVLHSFERMTLPEAEKKAQLMSKNNPNDIYYVKIDDIMNPTTDVRWVNGKQYHYSEVKLTPDGPQVSRCKNSLDSVTSANYGGAFDVEPEQYFTREEINEVGEEVCERLKPLFNSEFKVTELYMDDKGDNNLTMEIESLATGEVFFANLQIDRRWGKNPRSMLLKAIKLLVDKFENAINQTSFELSSGVDTVDGSTDTNVEGAVYNRNDIPGYDKWKTTPPEGKELFQEDTSEEYVETHLDAVILMDEDGSWTYEDETYPWARNDENKEGNWYANEHSNVRIADPIDVVEKVDELLVSLLPEDPGRYHIQGSVTLAFNLSGVEYDETFHGWSEREGNIVDRDYYTDDAEVEFNAEKSSIDYFQWKMIGPGEEVDVQAQQDVEAAVNGSVGHWTVVEGPKKTAARGYDNWSLLEKVGQGVTPRYALYDNNIESFDQVDDYRFQLSKLSPYDNTEYVWCRFKDQMASYYRAGKLQCHESMIENLDNFEEIAEWQNFIIERCLARLESFNGKLKSNIDRS